MCTCQVKRERGGTWERDLSSLNYLAAEKRERCEKESRGTLKKEKRADRERERERESGWLGVRRWDKNIQLQHGLGKIDI